MSNVVRPIALDSKAASCEAQASAPSDRVPKGKSTELPASAEVVTAPGECGMVFGYSHELPLIPIVCPRPVTHGGRHGMRLAQPVGWLQALDEIPRDTLEFRCDLSDAEFPGGYAIGLGASGGWLATAIVVHPLQEPPHFVVPCGWFGSHTHYQKTEAMQCVERTISDVREQLRELQSSRALRKKEERDRARRRKLAVGPTWPQLRRRVLIEEPLCRRCGQRATDVDHVVPLWRGGSQGRENLQALCKPCHRQKTREGGSPRAMWAHHDDRPPLVEAVDMIDVADRLGVQLRTVQRWVKRGTIPTPEAPGSWPWWEWNTIARWAEHRARRNRPTTRSGSQQSELASGHLADASTVRQSEPGSSICAPAMGHAVEARVRMGTGSKADLATSRSPKHGSR